MYNTIAIVVTIALYLFYQKWSSRNINNITGSELKALLSNGTKGFQLIDVRTPAEFNGNHVKGFRNIPLDQLNSRLKEIDADKPVYVMCASGGRSIRACKNLSRAGFKEITNLRGGIASYPR